jgi:hypothetical protein
LPSGVVWEMMVPITKGEPVADPDGADVPPEAVPAVEPVALPAGLVLLLPQAAAPSAITSPNEAATDPTRTPFAA